MLLPNFEYSEPEKVQIMNLDERIERAVALLRINEPSEGYYMAFSGGKDSCAIKCLAQIAGVKFDAFYSNTTIDPPELVRFIKSHHPEVKWNNPKLPMMKMVAEAAKVPPTRSVRWCCSVYKEQEGDGRPKIFGVRAAESKAREKRWKEVTIDADGRPVICPIVFWSDDQLWELIKERKIPYCSLYDEGFKRLGCVGCPLTTQKNQAKEFKRWPRYEANWKKAIIANWEKFKDVPRVRDGLPRFQAKFKTGEDFWKWWITAKTPDYLRGECQMQNLWSNEDVSDAIPKELTDEGD